ncbi:MAG: YnbE family lipoprotein [Pseudomonadota bacterium]
MIGPHAKWLIAPALFVSLGLSACAPTVKVQAPDKPITINLNVKIDQEVRVRLDKDIEDLIADNPDIF